MDFIKDLRCFQDSKQMVEIYTDQDDMDRFCCGTINSIDDEFVYINYISEFGDEAGISVRRLSDIYRIEYGGKYEKRLEKLYTIKKQSHDNYAIIENFEKFLKTLILSKTIVTITSGTYDNNIEVIGIVEKIDDDKIYLKEISRYAEQLGTVVILKADVYDISYGSNQEKDIQLLLDV